MFFLDSWNAVFGNVTDTVEACATGVCRESAVLPALVVV